MNSNIAFHLILDVARFYSLESIASMRYNEEIIKDKYDQDA